MVFSTKVDKFKIKNTFLIYFLFFIGGDGVFKRKVFERSDDYRKNFLRYNQGIFRSGNYHCSYCGKILTRKKLRVDHLIPIHKVKKFGVGRIFMFFDGISDINDVKNLVPSCERCNSKKGAKMGFWLIRGNIGKHFGIWLFWWSLLLAVTGIIIYENWHHIRPALSQIFTSLAAFFS